MGRNARDGRRGARRGRPDGQRRRRPRHHDSDQGRTAARVRSPTARTATPNRSRTAPSSLRVPTGSLRRPSRSTSCPVPTASLRVNVEHPKGVSRGAYLFHVRYRTSLLRSGGIVKDGAMMGLRWTGPTWSEGIDAARCTFALPAAPTEPRAASGRPYAAGGWSDDPESAASATDPSETTRRRIAAKQGHFSPKSAAGPTSTRSSSPVRTWRGAKR